METNKTGRRDGLLADYLTSEEVAAQLNVCTKTLRDWCSMGVGPVRTCLGRQRIYHKQDVADWLRSQREDVAE